jgi:hypothetical protein
MQRTLSIDFEVVTEYSESQNGLHPVVQTVADGLVDIVADNFVSTFDRSKYVDFSYPVEVHFTK